MFYEPSSVSSLEASVDGAFTDGLQAVGTSLSVHWPHAFSPGPSALGSIRELLLLQAEQSVNAKIKMPTRRVGRQN